MLESVIEYMDPIVDLYVIESDNSIMLDVNHNFLETTML